MQFSTDPVESIIKFDALILSPKIKWISEYIEDMIKISQQFQTVQFRSQKARNLRQDLPTKAKNIKILLKDFIYQMQDTGIYGASIAILAVIVELELGKRQCETMPERQMCDAMITKADLIRHALTRLMDCERTEYGQLMMFGSPKLKCLVHFLENYMQDHENAGKELKGLVFVQRRHSAKVIYHILKRVFQQQYDANPDDSGEPPIRPDFMVGRSGEIPESIEAILCDKNNRRVIERFKKNETNLIVASSVLEEGMDLQSCNLVIRYDKSEHFSSYVQTKGRARMKDSQYVIMVQNEDAEKYFRKLRNFKLVEAKLKDFLVGKTINRKPPLEEEIAEELYNELIPPFFTRGGATLTALGALQLLNRYAMLVSCGCLAVFFVLFLICCYLFTLTIS